MTTMTLPEMFRVTDVTHAFIGPLRVRVRVRARDADNEEVRHIRHRFSQEVRDA